MQSEKSQVYKIKIGGLLEARWRVWFEDLEMSHEGNDTVLTGYVQDQSALHGVLNRIRDLNFLLISVNRVNF